MQKGILIKTGDHVLAKKVYAGCEHCAEAEYNRLREKHPGLVISYHDDTDPDFANAVVTDPMEIN